MATSRRVQRFVQKSTLWAVLGVLVLLLVLVGRATWTVYAKMNEAHTLRIGAEEERDRMKARAADIEASLSGLQTERGVESVIRSRYPLVKPGETEFILVNDATPTTTVQKPPESPWERLKALF